MIGSSRQGFIKGKLCLTYVTDFKEITGLVDAWRVDDVAYLDFSKALNLSVITSS